MRFLTDENVATSVVAFLRDEGHTVIDVKERGWQRKSDQLLVALARQHRCIILTHDRDFLATSDVAVILLRFRRQRPDNVCRTLVRFLSSSLAKRLRRPITVILKETTVQFHIRRPR